MISGLRIAQVCADSGVAPGSTKGAALHLRGLAQGLTDLRHRVVTWSRRPPEGPHPVPVRSVSELPSLEVGDVDVVYERYSLGHLGGLREARRLGVPFVLEVNAPLVDEAGTHRPRTVSASDRPAENLLLAEADLVVAVSSDLSRWVGERRRGPVATIANGHESRWFASQTHQESPEFDLVFLGNPRPWHGADRLVGLLKGLRLLGHRPDLLMIGGGQGADALRRTAHRCGVGAQLHMGGAVRPEEVPALLTRCRVGLAPYPRIEPFYFCPLKIVDYLAAGLPVVSTRQGDIPRMVADAGVVVNPDSERSLVRAVAAVLENPDLAAEMGRSGLIRARTTMTWDHVARRTVSAIGSLVAAPSALR